MIGPIASHQSTYVAECGRVFLGYAEGRTHERTCPACQADTVNTLATLDHRGPLVGYCFMGLNFTPEQFDRINVAIVDHMAGKSLEFGVEEAIVELIEKAVEK